MYIETMRLTMLGSRSSSQRPAAIMASMAARRPVFGSVSQGGTGSAEGIETRWLNIARVVVVTEPENGSLERWHTSLGGLMDKRAVWSTKVMVDGNHGMEDAGGMQVKSGARAGGAGELPAWHVGPQGCLRSGVGQTHHTTPPMLLASQELRSSETMHQQTRSSKAKTVGWMIHQTGWFGDPRTTNSLALSVG